MNKCIICEKTEGVNTYEFLGFSVCSNSGDCAERMVAVITSPSTYGAESPDYVKDMFKKIRENLKAKLNKGDLNEN